MSKVFLGSGIGFPLQLNSQTQDLQIVEYEESVYQSVLTILGTAKGERAMRPDFGCGIYDLTFEPQTDATASTVSQMVQEALLRFEPRIDVVDVEVASQSEPAGEVLRVNVHYQVRATNNAFNLVYPFYLERSIG
jgi:uncharacterized protein